MSFLMSVAGYRTTENKRNGGIREELNIFSINEKVGRQLYEDRKKWIDHVLRMEVPKTRKFLKEYEPIGKRRQNKKKWEDHLQVQQELMPKARKKNKIYLAFQQ